VDDLLVSLALLALLLLLLGSGLWVALSLLGVGFAGIALFTERPPGQILATTVFSAQAEWSLVALPLFVWMGEILFRSRLSGDLFAGISPWLRHLPGRLVHVNVLGCGLFAAVSGSSAATCVTVGKISIPELESRGYDRGLVLGSIAGSGTLGLLIPPSIIMIVYGVAAEESIARLFIAGVLPGAMVMALFMAYIALWSLLHPARVPPPEPPVPFRQKLAALRRLLPVTLLILGVVGAIYGGVASPTDAAAVGVALSLLLVWLAGDLSRASFVAGLLAATRTSCMIAFILAGAAYLTSAMGYTGIPRALAAWIAELGLSNYLLIAALSLFFILLGCFLDGISIVVLTTAVILPMVREAGLDPIWFGIYLVLMVEMAQITPPVGFNLFVLQGLTGRDLVSIARASLPFFLLLVLAVVLLTLLPEIATWLPQEMTRR
jgi:tripartite ATP-independent transporter DctM subunit